MSKPRAFRFVVAFLILAAAAAGWPHAAEDSPLDIVVCGNVYSTGHPWSWETTAERYKEEINDKEFHEIRVDLYKRFMESENQNRNPDLKDRFKQALDRYAIKSVEIAAGVERFDSDESSGRRFFIITKDLIPDESGRMQRLVLLFKGQPYEIDFADCGDGNANASQLNELRYLANSLVILSDLQGHPDILRLEKQITELESQFDTYLFEGFPLFPWEAMVNSALLADDLLANGPPQNVIVLLHPAAAVDFSTEGFNESDPGFAFALNVLGWVHYNEDYSRWWGASVLAASSDSDGFGAGLNLHYKNFSLGVAWYDRTDRGSLFHDDPSVLMSWDLYQFVGEKHRQYRDFHAKVDAKILKIKEKATDALRHAETDAN